MSNSSQGFNVYNPNLPMGNNPYYAFQQNIPNQYGMIPYNSSQQLSSMQDINSMFNNPPAVSPTPAPAPTAAKKASPAKSVSFDTLMNNVMKEITNITMLKCG
ncbi:MAG: hypothetical protein ACYDDA_05865 [Acidiferrobacteraceae bacterium]